MVSSGILAEFTTGIHWYSSGFLVDYRQNLPLVHKRSNEIPVVFPVIFPVEYQWYIEIFTRVVFQIFLNISNFKNVKFKNIYGTIYEC